MGFNGDNLKAIFDQRFGKGAFDSGVNQAYQNGHNQWLAAQQAQAQQDYLDQMKQQEAAQKAQQKAQQNDPVYKQQNAQNYFQDSSINKDLHTKGAFQWVKDLQNDPMKQAELKKAGYDVKAIADQAYNVASNGKFKSASAFGQYFKDLNSQTQTANKAAAKQEGFGNTSDWWDAKLQQGQAENKLADQQQLKAANDTLLSMHNDAIQRQVQNQGIGNFGDEFQRGVARFGNTLTLGGLGELDKKLHGGALNPLLADRNGAAGWLDKGVDFAGSAVPFLLSDGATSAVGGAKLAALGGKGLAGKVGELAIRGAGSGALVGAGQEGVKAGFNPQQFDLTQALKNVGIDAGVGAVANPLLHGAGGLLKQLNLNKQLTQVLEHQPTQVDPETFVKTLQDMKKPTGDVSNVVADQPKVMPTPFETRYNLKPQIKPEPTVKANDLKQNDWFNFTQQQKNIPTSRNLIPNVTVPKIQSSNVRSLADDTLNRSESFSNKPPEGFNQRLKDVQQEMHNESNKKSADPYFSFSQSSKSLPKARPNLNPITRASSLDPLHRSQTYWKTRYHEFATEVQSNYHSNDLSEEKIQKLWEQFAKKDEPKNIHDVVDLAHGNGSADLTHKVLNTEHRLNETLKLKKTDTSKGFKPLPNKNIDELYNKVRKPTDPKTFDELIKMAEMEHNQANPSLTTMLRLDPRIKQSISKLNELGKPTVVTPKIEPTAKPKVKLPELKSGPQNPHDLLQSLKVNRKESIPEGEPKQDNKSMLVPLNLGDNSVKSIKTDKMLPSMNKAELQDTLSKLEKQEELYKGQKGKKAEAQLKQIQKDKEKVNEFLMKMDLQKFGEKEPKETPKVEKKTEQERAIEHSQSKQIAKKLEEKGNPITVDTVKQLQEMKDIGPNQVLTKNIYELADKLPKEIGDNLKSKLDTAKSAHVDNLEKRSNDVYTKMVKELGINKGSKDSALVQDFGEKTLAKKYLEKQGVNPDEVSKEELDKINLEQLKQKAPDKWKNIMEADQYFRTEYNKLIDEVNTVRKQIYPKNPDKIVPKRDDYYHHFNELEGFDHFKDLIMNSNAIDPHLAGISPNTKPNAKWAGFMQRRGNGAYKSDAVGGFLKYLQASSHSTHIDPMIKVLRDTAETIATATEGTKNLNNVKAALEDHANDLAGKTNPIDRLVQDKVIGRNAFRFINVVNGHIKKNMILGNMGSLLGQIGNVPLTIGKAKLYSIQGVTDTLSYAAKHLLPGAEKDSSGPISQSPFLKERFSSHYFRRFDNGLLKKPEHMALWMLETADRSGTYFAWNSMYRKALAKKIADPIKYADEQTRHIIAGRGVGEVPIAQKSKIMGIVAPFTLEVGNAWKVLGKQMSEKDFAGVVTFLAASYGLNQVMNKVKGSEVSFNPVGAVMDGYNQTDGTTTEKLKGAGANLLGETVGNIPGGNYIPQIVGLKSQQTKQALFGNRSPDRFGTGVGVASTVFKPGTDLIGGNYPQALKDLLPLVLPFGGNQIKKSYGGIEALSKGGSYDSKGKLQYPVDSKNTSDLLHSLLLGPTTTAKGQDYYNNNGKPLSDKQTLQYQNAPNKQDYYNKLMAQRQVSSIQTKINDVQKDSSLTPQVKQQKIMIFIQELQKLKK